MIHTYWVYILASITRTLYVGVTNDLERRVHQHRVFKEGSFTSKYRINRLVWFEAGNTITAVISREKQIKGWNRSRKVALIEASNPAWVDLSEGLNDVTAPSACVTARDAP